MHSNTLFFRRKDTAAEQPIPTTSPVEGVVDETMETEEWVEGEWAPDPNEPRYCLCNQVSYGDMVVCVILFCFIIRTKSLQNLCSTSSFIFKNIFLFIV